jgi:hypothetical protein
MLWLEDYVENISLLRLLIISSKMCPPIRKKIVGASAFKLSGARERTLFILKLI